jgi:metal-responsive CopG/Arc/MetJ family transcriptional regulator
MTKVARFTVSVPIALLEALDDKLTAEGESRSAVVRRLLETALREVEEQEDIQRYIDGYKEQPQTEEEFGWSDQVAGERLAELPWR